MNVKGFCTALFFFTACSPSDSKAPLPSATIEAELIVKATAIERQPYETIADIPLPPKYKRLNTQESNFDYYLQHISLKEDATVYLYNGAKKNNQSAQFAVLNISVGNENLQQCADAVMRLRAEYLYEKKAFDEIEFRDNENRSYKFTSAPSRENFTKYLRTVFGMCGTASLAKQLPKVKADQIKIGDVLIKGGFPGHAVIVMDMAINDAGNKIFLLAQSYMPAQDIHVLKNPMDTKLSPWYALNSEYEINTPEYNFTANQWHTW